MTEHNDLERLLGEAFDARARAAVPDHATPPPPRFEQPDAPVVSLTGRRRRWIAPLAAAAAVVVAATIGVTIAETQGDGDAPASSHPITPAERDAQPVHVKLLNSDGQTYGVGMPVIAYFSRKITDARAFQAATTATVDGRPLEVAWYFEPSKAGKGPYEAHLRPANYWPADSSVQVRIASDGATAGKGLGFDNSLTLDFRTGPTNYVEVDDATKTLTLSSDGKKLVTCPVSLGAATSPTMSGRKVVMEKLTATKSGSAAPVYAQRLTYGGEFLQAAPTKGLRVGHDATGGSVLVSAKDARELYGYLRIGDIVDFVDMGPHSPAMQLGYGYGDWQVRWSDWLTGGAVRTH